MCNDSEIMNSIAHNSFFTETLKTRLEMYGNERGSKYLLKTHCSLRQPTFFYRYDPVIFQIIFCMNCIIEI